MSSSAGSPDQVGPGCPHVVPLLDAFEGLAEDTIVVYSTDNGPHTNSWPDAGMTPFRNEKNSNWEGAYRVPAVVRWPGHIPAGETRNGIVSHNDWFVTLLAAAGDTDIAARLAAGAELDGASYKVHLDGHNQLDHLTGRSDESPRKHFFYVSDDGDLTALRYDNWKFVFLDQRVTGTKSTRARKQHPAWDSARVTAVHRVLAVVATMLVLVGTVAGVVHREVLDADRFSAHVDSIRADPAVARQLGVLVTDRLLAAQPDLTAVRPLLESTAASVVASPALAPAIRIAMVGPLYRTLTGRGGDSVVLRLADVAAVVIGATAVAAPQTRAALPAELDVRLSQFGARGSTGEVLGWVHLVTWVSWLAPLAGLLILVGSGATLGAEGPGMRRRLMGALTATGRGVLAAAVTLAVLLVLTGVLVGRQDDSTLTGALLRATWQELDGAFWDAAGILAVAGLALAAAGRSGPTLFARDVQPADLAARAWSAVLHPRPGLGPRTGRAGLLLLVGIALLLQPLEVLRAWLWAMGLGLVVVAVAVLVSVATTAVRERSVRHDSDARARHGAGWRWVLAGLGLVVLITVLVLGALPGRDSIPVARASDSETCNGYVVLCQRRYNDVAFPATHNAMAAADQPGWFFAEQPDGLIPQLEHGIRVLLIDSWYGQHSQRPGIIVNTDQDRVAALAEARASFGEAAVESALRVRHALRLTPRGPVEPYLCHALCALGSTPWLPAMTEVRTWLAAHPRNVVTLFVQDTVSPQDTATVMRRAGLLPYVYTPAGDQQQWPSLGQMIESGERLVILMENHGGGSTYPWLLDGFHWVQDTPFLFRSPAQFSCRDNRGPATAPLFLLNHWITQKHREVSNAALVNARDVLLPRAEECRRQRGRMPNFVAVDFYDKGDLFGVVNTLNRTP